MGACGRSSRWSRVIGPALLFCSLLAIPPIQGAVLTSITIDGDVSDWAPVLADPTQTSYDGPAGSLPDLDAPVPSTGRDLSTFAWTHDANYFYMFVRRVGSSKNRQEFWYYLDLNGDSRMDSGEKVFQVSWWGKTRKTLSVMHDYIPQAAGGDAMTDPSGLADGYTMPGTLIPIGTLETLHGGSSNGLEMESRVSWGALGLTAPAPFLFHISSSNSTNVPAQIDDNLGGPGGTIGTTFQAAVTLTPDRSTTITAGGIAVMAHTLTHSGSGLDTLNFSQVVGGDFTPSLVELFNDLDGDQLLDPGEPALLDTDGDGSVDSGPLAGSTVLNLLVRVTAPGGIADGDTCTVDLTATSSINVAVSDGVTLTLVVATPQITLVKSVDHSVAAPGELLTYTIDFISAGVTTAFNVTVVDAIPPECLFEAGSAQGAGTQIEFSHDGGVSFDSSETAPVTHIRWTLLAPLEPAETSLVSYGARVR